MSTDSRRPFGDAQRRRLGAITALVAGIFLGLTLLPLPLTGSVGKYIGHALWQTLGAGALGIPLLGIGLALAGFDRLGKLDMKRAAILIAGLSVLVPYVIGICISTYYAQKQRRTQLLRDARKHMQPES